jgi:hypothetical protein
MQAMGVPVSTWKVVVDLTDPLDVDGKPVTFRTFDQAAVQPQLRAFRAATIESAGRTGLRIRAEIDASSPREASDQLWQVIERVLYPDSDRRQFGSVKVHMSVTPAMTLTTELGLDHRAS